MDLAKFLTARIGDDEAAARAAFGPGIALNWPALPAAVDVFIDRYGPLRAVREAGAKRKILAEHAMEPGMFPPSCARCYDTNTAQYPQQWEPLIWPCPTIR